MGAGQHQQPTPPQAPQEPRFIDQKRHTRRPWPWATGQDAGGWRGRGGWRPQRGGGRTHIRPGPWRSPSAFTPPASAFLGVPAPREDCTWPEFSQAGWARGPSPQSGGHIPGQPLLSVAPGAGVCPAWHAFCRHTPDLSGLLLSSFNVLPEQFNVLPEQRAHCGRARHSRTAPAQRRSLLPVPQAKIVSLASS